MKYTIKNQVKSHLLNLIENGVLTDKNRHRWGLIAFNAIPRIFGYSYTEDRPNTVNAGNVTTLHSHIYFKLILDEANASNITELQEFCE